MSFSRKITCPYCGTANRIPAESLTGHPLCETCGRDMFAARPIEVDGGSFQSEVLEHDRPVLVDFWAPWCGPCKAMEPAFEQAALAMESKVRFARLNTDEARDLAGHYGIRGIPTMILFSGGTEVARHSGAMMGGMIEAWLDEQLAHAAEPQQIPLG